MSTCQNCKKDVFLALNSYGERVIMGWDGSLRCAGGATLRGHR